MRTAAEAQLRAGLETFWAEKYGVYTAMQPCEGTGREDIVDAASLLAVLDADLSGGAHSAEDERVWATFDVIENLFAREFPINRGRKAPALGRNRADRYFGGGAWYPTTLAAASLCYRHALRLPERRSAFLARGDAFMTTIRDLIPPDGALSEQVDRETGRQTSARDLTWSYAAFITAAELRKRALREPR
jgi:glucoamylase